MQKWKVLATPCYEETITVSASENDDEVIKVYQEFIIESVKLLGFFFIGDIKYKICGSKKIK
jgi:hypothetical protein